MYSQSILYFPGESNLGITQISFKTINFICIDRKYYIFDVYYLKWELFMKKVISSGIVGMLIFTSLLSIGAIAGDEEDPEIEDKRWDVKLFGLFGGLPQPYFKHIDIISGWFYEDINERDYLFVSLKLRDLQDTSETFEALYSVTWIFNQGLYQTVLRINSFGIFGTYYVRDADDQSHSCEGTLDVENDIITWKIPKEIIGDPYQGSALISTSAYALLRPFDEETQSVGADLFKDLTNKLIGYPSERYGDIYIIKY